MKLFHLKIQLALGAIALSLFPATDADAQLFGRKKKAAQNSSSQTQNEGPQTTSLFPDSGNSGYVVSSTPSAPTEAIFKGGKPKKVAPTNYIIKNGRRVYTNEKTSEKKGFFRRVIRDKPAPEKPSAPRAEYPNTSGPVTSGTREPTFANTSTDSKPDRKIRPFSRIANLRRKKDETVSPFEETKTLTDIANNPTNQAPPKPAPAPALTPTTRPTPPPPQKETSRLERLANNIPKPSIPKLRRKNDAPIDTTGGEVLVNRGGTLTPSGADTTEDFRPTATNTRPASTGPAQPPRNENGTIVYNSWDDVEGTRRSAADIIVRDMKAQEAAHRKKVEAAQREYEARVKKAQEDARIRAIMQGGMPLGGFPGSP